MVQRFSGLLLPKVLHTREIIQRPHQNLLLKSENIGEHITVLLGDFS
jgi:hypothetical protein